MEKKNSSAFSTILLVLLSTKFCRLFISNVELQPQETSPVMYPMGFVFSRLLDILIVYIASVAYSKQQPCSLQSLFSKIQQTWHRALLSYVSVELYYSAWTSLLVVLKTLTVYATNDNVSSKAIVLSGLMVAVVLWFAWPTLFAHSEIACKMSLVMSIAEEEGGWEGGMEAMKRGGDVVEGRKLRGFLLTVAMGIVERRVGSSGFVGVLVKFLVWFVYTRFYHKCKKGTQGKGGTIARLNRSECPCRLHDLARHEHCFGN